VLAVAGWALLHVVPVQTDVQQLVSQSLRELNDIQTVQVQTGYTNELDLFIRGSVVTGSLDAQTGAPNSVEWQCQAAHDILTGHQHEVTQAVSIGDFFIGSATAASGTARPSCVSTLQNPQPSPSPTPSTSPSPSGSPAPSATASPSAVRGASGAVPASRRTLAQADATPTATPTTAATPSTAVTPLPTSSGGATPSASASPTPNQSSNAVPQTLFLCDLRLFPLLTRTLVMDIPPDNPPCPAVDKYRQTFISQDAGPINPTTARIALGVVSTSVADEAKLVASLRTEVSNAPEGLSATPTGLAVLATTAYDNIVGRAYLLNLAPLGVVAIALFVIYREPRRALLPVLPTVMAAGWAPLLLLLLGRLPGGIGTTLGSLNPLTVVLGALVIALATEFGVVLLGRFYEERRRGLDPDAAAVAALAGVGRAIRVSALTLGAGFGVLAISGLFPNSLPLLADFGLAVVIDLALAVGAVFLVMLPVAVALERRAPLRLAPLTDRTAAAATAVPSAKPPSGSRRRSKGAAVSEKLEPAPPGRRRGGRRPGS
jgi:predicted RND superfamily exporter protein